MRENIKPAVLALMLVGGVLWAMARSHPLHVPWAVLREPAPQSAPSNPLAEHPAAHMPVSPSRIPLPPPPLQPQSIEVLRARCVEEVRGRAPRSDACERFDANVKAQPFTGAGSRVQPTPYSPPLTSTTPRRETQTGCRYVYTPRNCTLSGVKGSIAYRQCRADEKASLDRACAQAMQDLEWASGTERECVREREQILCHWSRVYQTVEP